MKKMLLSVFLGIVLPGVSAACSKAFNELFQDATAPYDINTLAEDIGKECDIHSSNLTSQDLAKTIGLVLDKLNYDEALVVAKKIFPYMDYSSTVLALDVLFKIPLQQVFVSSASPAHFKYGNYKTWLELIVKGVQSLSDLFGEHDKKFVTIWFHERIINRILFDPHGYSENFAFDQYTDYEEGTMFDVAKIACSLSDQYSLYYVLSNYFDANERYGSRNIREIVQKFINVAGNKEFVASTLCKFFNYVGENDFLSIAKIIFLLVEDKDIKVALEAFKKFSLQHRQALLDMGINSDRISGGTDATH